MQNLIPVNIVIGDRSYRVRIDSRDEETVRKLTKRINDQILEFKTQFAGKDMQDYVSMVLLWFVTEQHSGSLSGNGEGFAEELNRLEELIDKTLASPSSP
jgi:cell division protein ZapA (FtsZ GTPase activity inhibitor)